MKLSQERFALRLLSATKSYFLARDIDKHLGGEARCPLGYGAGIKATGHLEYDV